MHVAPHAIRRSAAQALLLLLLALLLGLGSNALRPGGLSLFQDFARQQAQNKAAAIEQVTPRQAMEMLNADSAVFVDAREAEFFQQGHVPGALNRPIEEVRAKGPGVLPRDKRLVIYCDGLACGKSRELAEILVEQGYSVAVMLDGIEGWVMSGGPLEGGK